LLEQDALDPALTRRVDVIGEPTVTEDATRDLDDDVIGGGACVVVEPRQALQARGAGSEHFHWAGEISARSGLLPRRAHALGRFRLEVAAKRIDVDASAAHKARIDGERPWRATAKDVDEHALDAALVKCRVSAERDQIPKQSRAIDPHAAIANHDIAVVGLAGHRASRPKLR